MSRERIVLGRRADVAETAALTLADERAAERIVEFMDYRHDRLADGGKIGAALSFRQAVEKSKENELNIFFYELGGESVAQILTDKPKTIGFFIGSEGGFEEKEAQLAAEAGAKTATLGKRILRAETAPLAALSVIMYQTGNFD